MSNQRYVSDELTHFVGRSFNGGPEADEQQYALLLDILKTGQLGASKEVRVTSDPSKAFSDNQYYKSNVVCFSDIPLADLTIHMAKYSRFGMAFKKSFLIERGANPVFYVVKNSLAKLAHGKMEKRAEYFDRMHAAILELFERMGDEWKSGAGEDYIKELLGFLVFHFFSFAKFYQEGLPPEHPENFYMEREWRIFGSLEFSLAEVTRIMFPKDFARRFRDDLPEFYGQINFS